MAKSCGIRIGARRFELVALEGTPKKVKVLAAFAGEVPVGEDPLAAAAGVLREAAKKFQIQSDNVGLAIDTGLAAFRTVNLPFDDREKTEQVIKFEVESQLPQWNIDDVIVDFHKLSGSGSDVQILVTAVPKAELRKRIAVVEKAGLDVFEADLESTAVVNAADAAGLLTEDSACVLVHIGEESTSVIVVDGGQVRSMRAIHIGAFPRVAAEAPAAEVDAQKNPETAEPAAPATPPDLPSPEQSAARLRRELGRTVTGAQVTQPLKAIYLCGHDLGARLEDAIGGVPVEVFKPFKTADGGGRPELCVAAFGAALARLGEVKILSSLRREELHYSGKFERLELPLAIAGLLLVTLLGVQLIMKISEIKNHAGNHYVWVQSNNGFMIGDLKEGRPGRLRKPSDAIKNYVSRIEKGEVDQNSYEQLKQIESLLRKEIDTLTKELGQGSDIQQPQSALEGLTLVLELIDGMDDQIGRYSLRSLQADYSAGRVGGEGDRVTVKLDMSFFGEDDVVASRNYNNFVTTIEAQPWCVEYVPKPSKPFDNGKGISVEAITIVMDLSKNAG